MCVVVVVAVEQIAGYLTNFCLLNPVLLLQIQKL